MLGKPPFPFRFIKGSGKSVWKVLGCRPPLQRVGFTIIVGAQTLSVRLWKSLACVSLLVNSPSLTCVKASSNRYVAMRQGAMRQGA